MALVRPRLTDSYGVMVSQEAVDFAIPFLDEDIPLYLDPFLLWKSPSQQDNALHTALINSFNHLGHLEKKGRRKEAVRILTVLSECEEVGFGHSHTRVGRRIGGETAEEVVELFRAIPEYERRGFVHFEEIQFFVDHISRDRISDIGCNLPKSFLVDYTIQQCERHRIPTERVTVPEMYSYRENRLKDEEQVPLPVNPESHKAILLVPKRWLRAKPWLDFGEYAEKYFPKEKETPPCKSGAGRSSQRGTREGALALHGLAAERVEVLTYNRQNYGAVQGYVAAKERTAADCKNDPLFSQIPVRSAKGCLKRIRNLRCGEKVHAGPELTNANQEYEQELAKLLASAFYPQLDFAQAQARTEPGGHIRDLIFYNNRDHPFLDELYEEYGVRQVVMEIKNVHQLSKENVNQLNRYLTPEFGRFGVLLTRNQPPAAVFRNTIDLWSGQRRCIVVLDDGDIEQIVALYESKQRQPLDVLKKKYVDFKRKCPG
jgi:hypothetical protein